MRKSPLLLLVLSCACPGGERGGDQATPVSRARGALVAKVDGAAIGVEQVRELAEATGLTPREALQRLEEEQLLVREAARRGYGRPELVERELRRALVQALLADTVERLRAEDIPAAQVRARFDEVARSKGIAADSFAEHEGDVRRELLLERRQAALKELTDSLRDRIGVKLSEVEVQRLLSDPAFWGESS